MAWVCGRGCAGVGVVCCWMYAMPRRVVAMGVQASSCNSVVSCGRPDDDWVAVTPSSLPLATARPPSIHRCGQVVRADRPVGGEPRRQGSRGAGTLAAGSNRHSGSEQLSDRRHTRTAHTHCTHALHQHQHQQ